MRGIGGGKDGGAGGVWRASLKRDNMVHDRQDGDGGRTGVEERWWTPKPAFSPPSPARTRGGPMPCLATVWSITQSPRLGTPGHPSNWPLAHSRTSTHVDASHRKRNTVLIRATYAHTYTDQVVAWVQCHFDAVIAHESNNTISYYAPYRQRAARTGNSELAERLRRSLVLRHPEDVETHRLRQRPALTCLG